MSRGLIFNGFAVLVATSLLASCIREDISEPSAPADGINCISLQIITGPQTRADGTTGLPADKAVLNSVDLFFYTSDAGDETPAVFKWHGKNATDDEKLNVSIPLELVDNDTLFDENNQCKVYAVINSSEATALVSSKEMPTISRLRALKVTTAFFADKKGFDDTAGLVMFTEESPPDKHLAEGDKTPNVVSYHADAKKATGHIYVNTPAAKIDLFVKFADTVYGTDPDDNQPYEWRVVKSNGLPTAETHMVNGVKSVLLGGWKWTDESRPTDEDYFDTRIMEDMDGVSVLRRLKEHAAEDSNDYPYVIEAPFYTYPNQWEITPLELRRTTLLLKVDWLPYDAGTGGEVGKDAVTTYYTVPLNLEENMLKPNKYYRVKVNINTLGGANFGKPVELTDCTLDVLEWGAAQLEADIRTTRYLEVQQSVLDRDGKTYTAIMNNTETISIPFYSSHKTYIKSASIRYMTYEKLDQTSGGFFTPQNGTVDAEGRTTTETRNDYFEQELEDLLENDYQGAYIDEARGTITVHHATRPTTVEGNHYVANYNGTEQYTYNSYYITIVLAHEDLPGQEETITIKQNPPVYIEGEVNASFNNNEDRRGITYNLCGWVRVNSNSNDPSGLGGIDPIGKGFFTQGLDLSSSNPVMYIVTSTQLSADSKFSKFHISDPRSNLRNLNLGGNTELPHQQDLTRYSTWTTAPHIHNGAGQTLQYYYPTVESMTQEDMYAIAPRYRMASSFGKTSGTMNRETARRRCAAYQEYGYPAGRWRMPTLGEMEYVTELSKLGYIPPLFGGSFLGITIDGAYWTAQGLYRVDSDGNLNPDNGGSGYVRCVYDDWYWTKEDADGNLVPDNLTGTAMQTFTWGDKEKNNPQEQPEPEAEEVPEP